MVVQSLSLVVSCLATLASATPLLQSRSTVSIPISKQPSNLPAAQRFAQDDARAKSFSTAATAPGSAPAVNADVSYVAKINVGTQNFTLIVDTGSSNTWIGADSKYQPSGSSVDTGNTFSIEYGSGKVSGDEYLDEVTLGGLTVHKQSIGVASNSTGFTGVDGIFGVGPVDLTNGTVSNTGTVPTFLDNLYSQGTISAEVLGVSFAPEMGSDTNDENGLLTLGGVDATKFTGPLTYFPKSTAPPYNLYWGIDVAALHYNDVPLTLSSSSAIVDTGTTLIYIPPAAYTILMTASGGAPDPKSGLTSYVKRPTGNITFTFGQTPLSLTPDQYLVPDAQYDNFGLDSKLSYSWINQLIGSVLTVDFIIGQKFLENYYSVYDTTESRIGFATAARA